VPAIVATVGSGKPGGFRLYPCPGIIVRRRDSQSEP